jgi:hypothetical protein
VARVVVDGTDLVLALPVRQKILGFHANLRVPLTSVRSVRVVSNPWMALRGRRMAGTAMRGVAAIGTWIHGDRQFDFCVLRRHEQALEVELATGRFRRWLVGLEPGLDGEAEADRIAAAAGIRRSG